jgi:hypothetical protein
MRRGEGLLVVQAVREKVMWRGKQALGRVVSSVVMGRRHVMEEQRRSGVEITRARRHFEGKSRGRGS